MVDLRIWILTHPASSWDVDSLKQDCLAAFSCEDLLVDVSVHSNTHHGQDALHPWAYIFEALAAQWQVGKARLATSFSLVSLMWHLRQLAGLATSFVRLASSKHRKKVAAESVRAARIAKGHAHLWQQASRYPAQLNLFLEDDVTLKDSALLVQLAKSLLKIAETDRFICDCSHSYSMFELGLDVRNASSDRHPAGVAKFDFAFTNTLASNFASPSLVQLTADAIAEGNCGTGLGMDLDLMRLWASASLKAYGMASSVRIFEQQSGFRIQKI